MLNPHRFDPITFNAPSGPMTTDWCGYHEGENICRMPAEHPLHFKEANVTSSDHDPDKPEEPQQHIHGHPHPPFPVPPGLVYIGSMSPGQLYGMLFADCSELGKHCHHYEADDAPQGTECCRCDAVKGEANVLPFAACPKLQRREKHYTHVKEPGEGQTIAYECPGYNPAPNPLETAE